MKYEVRNNNRNARDHMSVFRATGNLHAIPNSCKKIHNPIIFSSQPLSSPILKAMFFSPSRKVFDFRFCPMYNTVTLGPSVLKWAWLSAKCFRVLWEVVIWFCERNSSSTFRKCTRFILSLFFFNVDWWAAQRKTTCCCNFLFISFDAFRLQLRVVQEWLQLTLSCIYSTFVCLSLIKFQWKWIITETCCKLMLQETPCYERHTQALFLIFDRKHDEIKPVRKVTHFENVPLSAEWTVLTLVYRKQNKPTAWERKPLKHMSWACLALTV